MSSTDSSSPPYRPDIPRRATDIPGVTRAGSAAAAPARAETSPDAKTLIVGREISLNGQITSCDRLVVEGKVEASIKDCQSIEIAESGLFRGGAEIEEADIRGRFEGNLTVSGRLLIRATGKVSGEIRYGQLEIELGGQITGTIDAGTSAAAPPRPAAVAGE